MQKFNGRRIVLGVCSSIAAYKAADLAAALAKAGADVRVIMTKNAEKIISGRVFSTLTRNPVSVDMWEKIGDWKPEHISLAQFAELMIVAPATANIMAKAANGLADDLMSATILAFDGALLMAPAMNAVMWEKPATQRNVRRLVEDGVEMIGPEVGRLSCGESGAGRMSSPETIFDAIAKASRRRK